MNLQNKFLLALSLLIISNSAYGVWYDFYNYSQRDAFVKMSGGSHGEPEYQFTIPSANQNGSPGRLNGQRDCVKRVEISFPYGGGKPWSQTLSGQICQHDWAISITENYGVIPDQNFSND